jgi:DNA-directed RNA polymerase alpha subunit
MGPRIELLLDESANDNAAQFRIFGFYHAGHATSFANSLRYSLHDNILVYQFAAVKPRLKIRDKEDERIFAEYSFFPGVKESLNQIMDNLSQVKFRHQETYDGTELSKQVHSCSIIGVGPGEVTTRSISKIRSEMPISTDFDIIHSDQPLFTIDHPDVSLTLDLKFVSSNSIIDNKSDYNQKGIELFLGGEDQLEDGWLLLPGRPKIIKVNYTILRQPDIVYAAVPKGRIYPEVLYLDLETDGSITPINALISARKALFEEHKDYADYHVIDGYELIQSAFDKSDYQELDGAELNEQDNKVLHNRDSLVEIQKSTGKNYPKETEFKFNSINIEDLGITARAYNCLKRAQINTLGDLLDYSKSDLLQIKNFGVKSAEEVLEALQNKLGVTLPD